MTINLDSRLIVDRFVTNIRRHLAVQSQHAAWYNFIQQFFGSKQMWLAFTQEYLSNGAPLRILDLGCGTAEVLQYLPPQTKYCGIDSHLPYIQSCQITYPQRGTFHCKDWRDFEEEESFDCVLLLGLLHHLNDAAARAVIEKGLRSLVSGGCVISLDGCRPDSCSRFEEFFYKSDRGKFVRTVHQYAHLYPSAPDFFVHRNWLRVPYQYLVCQLRKD